MEHVPRWPAQTRDNLSSCLQSSAMATGDVITSNFVRSRVFSSSNNPNHQQEMEFELADTSVKLVLCHHQLGGLKSSSSLLMLAPRPHDSCKASACWFSSQQWYREGVRQISMFFTMPGLSAKETPKKHALFIQFLFDLNVNRTIVQDGLLSGTAFCCRSKLWLYNHRNQSENSWAVLGNKNHTLHPPTALKVAVQFYICRGTTCLSSTVTFNIWKHTSLILTSNFFLPEGICSGKINWDPSQ